ncbi:hypothetical protein E2C01_022872 [Portunus trituberculatus]|uniref:Uncharacterized protein n=1 Tax=Portunus trituberculatus TaxID=210409 RepID=A0A5B7E8A0_PORTR|nr:hypothetical protein [Portunus trituberculatus]
MIVLYVMKLWFLHVWPSLQQEMRTQEVLAAVLQPILKLISDVTTDEYENIILPHFSAASGGSRAGGGGVGGDSWGVRETMGEWIMKPPLSPVVVDIVIALTLAISGHIADETKTAYTPIPL